jgi:DNA-binding MarR family transcriptional regulator
MKHLSRRGPAPDVRFESLEQEVFLNLWRTYDRLRLLEEQFFEGFGLTPQQYNVLRLLKSVSPGSLTTLGLAQRLVSRAPDITRMLDKLDRRDLIERARPAENRRQVQVRLRPRGLALLDRLAAPLKRCHQAQLGHLGTNQLRRLCRLLQQARAPHETDQGFWGATT